MSDHDLDDAPDREALRAAFRHGGTLGGDPRAVDADDFLARVHTGSHRRRARRTAGVAASALAAVGIVVAGMTTVVGDMEPSDAPVAQGGSTSAPAPPSTQRTSEPQLGAGPLAVYELEVPDDKSVWALASPDCGRATLCPVIKHSTDNGATWRTRSPETTSGEPVIDDIRHLGVADNGRDVVVAGSGAATSHDAGQTWQAVDLAADRPVRGLATGADESVLVLDGPGAPALVTSPVGSDSWAPADPPVDADEQLGAPFAGGDTLGATVTAANSSDPVAVVVRTTDSDWVRVDAPCGSRTPLVASDGTSIWYLCHGGSTSVLATAPVDGLGDAAWVRADLPAATDAGLGAWGDGSAVAAVGERVFRVDERGRSSELSGSASGLELPRDDYTFRASDKSWLATFRGTLLHTTDDGQSWSKVRIR